MRDKAAFQRGVARLQAMGYEVELDQAALNRHTRFAGDDATRIAAIGRAAASGADVAMISRGGYGLTRILPGLPYKAIAKAVERGTDFVGLSDFTAFQSALLAKTGAMSWAGPDVEADFGRAEGPDDIMQACFEDLLLGQGEGAGWRWPGADYKAHLAGKAATDAMASTANTTKTIAVDAQLAGAVADLSFKKSLLWGGNLTVLTALLGTPWFPKIKGGILFVEDVGEHPYRIERMLSQLLHAGVLGQQRAVLLGQFTQFRLAPHDRGYKLASVVAWLRRQIKAPVITGLPFGHVPTKVLLPVRAQVRLMVQDANAMLLWQHRH